MTLGARGWDNQLWRLGDDLVVRLPWATESADALLLKEHTWLPVLAPALPLPVPVPLRLGSPSPRFPRPWIVTTWVPGVPADLAPAAPGRSTADALAAFLSALHQPAPADAPAGRGRGGPLGDAADSVNGALSAATERGLLANPEEVEAIWLDALLAPAWLGPPVWLHGDLHAANVLTTGGTICGIVDFGDLCAGDPALDLAGAWTLLPDVETIARFHRMYEPTADASTWRRSRGWAVWRALGCLLIADAGRQGLPGGKETWGPPALTALRLLSATG